MSIELPIVLTALFVGVLVGLTGVGGGAVMTPTLILLFGVPTTVAIATDLVFATITKSVAALLHSKSRSIDWPVAKKIWSGSIPGTVVGILLLVYFASEFVFAINLLLALLLLATATTMFMSSGLQNLKGNRAPFIGGSLIGFAVATTSVGAGAMGMVLLRSLIGDEDPRKLVGTDIVHAIPIAMIAGASYFIAGFFDPVLLMNLLVGSIPGAIFGSLIVSKVNAFYLRKLVAATLVIAAVGIALKAVGLI